MRFVCSSKDVNIRALMAHSFLKKAYEQKQLDSVVNMNEVIDALEPSKLIDRCFELFTDAINGKHETN